MWQSTVISSLFSRRPLSSPIRVAILIPPLVLFLFIYSFYFFISCNCKVLCSSILQSQPTASVIFAWFYDSQNREYCCCISNNVAFCTKIKKSSPERIFLNNSTRFADVRVASIRDWHDVAMTVLSADTANITRKLYICHARDAIFNLTVQHTLHFSLSKQSWINTKYACRITFFFLLWFSTVVCSKEPSNIFSLFVCRSGRWFYLFNAEESQRKCISNWPMEWTRLAEHSCQPDSKRP